VACFGCVSGGGVCNHRPTLAGANEVGNSAHTGEGFDETVVLHVSEELPDPHFVVGVARDGFGEQNRWDWRWWFSWGRDVRGIGVVGGRFRLFIRHAQSSGVVLCLG
jgi:hypothetical protein